MQDISEQKQAAQDEAGNIDQIQLVSFWVGAEEFAVEILAVREINRMLEITRVPQSPECVEGVINLRGLIVPVIDIRKRFGLEPSEATDDTRIVVVESDGRIVGFVVDKVNEVLRLDQSVVDQPPALGGGQMSQYISGVGKLEDRLIILLDVKLLVGDLELEKAA